jgi:hypothetical protein
MLRSAKALALTGYDVLTDAGILNAARTKFSTTLRDPTA